jgi:hypothetical protein
MLCAGAAAWTGVAGVATAAVIQVVLFAYQLRIVQAGDSKINFIHHELALGPKGLSLSSRD